MISLRLTFLLSIDLRKEKSVTKLSKKSKKGKKGKKAKKPTKTKTARKKVKSVEEVNSEELPYSIITVDHPVAYVHLEYELFKGFTKYAVDVICWGSVAKVYSQSGVTSFKTILKGDTAWVPIFIEHYLDQLSLEEVRNLLDNRMSFKIKVDKKSMGAQAKSDKISAFYALKEEEIEENDFTQVYTNKPQNEDNEAIKLEIAKLLRELLTFPVLGEIISSIFRKNEAHRYHVAKLIRKVQLHEPVWCKDVDESETQGSKKGGKPGTKGSWKSKKAQKGSKSTKSSKSTCSETVIKLSTSKKFSIPGSIFLTDPLLATYRSRTPMHKIANCFVLLSSENLLTLRQKYELNPLVVKVRKISNLPQDLLDQKGFKKVQVRCNVPEFVQFTTKPRDISGTVHFEESVLIYTNTVPSIKLQEFLQTRRLVAEIQAVKVVENSTPDPGSKHSKKKQSKKKSKVVLRHNSAASETLLLSVAHFDLSSLSDFHLLFREKAPCHNLCSQFLPEHTSNEEEFMDHFTVNELNLKLYQNTYNASPLTEATLIANNTTLTIEANFLVPQFPAFYIKDTTYKRFLLIIIEQEAAKLFFNSIIRYNHEMEQGQGPVMLPNFYLKTPSVQAPNDDLLSGFIIDDGSCFIFCVEGQSNGFILSLLHQISTFNYSVARVFYNSEFLFEERLYRSFFTFSGFYLITLKMPLYDIFKAKEVYLRGNLPFPCFKAVQKLQLIFHSTTFRSILNYNFLPTETELVSFSVEFGLQLGFKMHEFTLKTISELLVPHVNLFGNMEIKMKDK